MGNMTRRSRRAMIIYYSHSWEFEFGYESGSGDVAIDLMGLTLNDLNLLSSTLGLNSVLWLNQNCLRKLSI